MVVVVLFAGRLSISVFIYRCCLELLCKLFDSSGTKKKKATFKHNVFWEEETLSVKINEGKRNISVKSHAIFCKKTDNFSRIRLYFLSINKNQPFCPVEYWLNLHCLIREFKK